MANFKEKINSFVKLIHSTNGVCKMLRNFNEEDDNGFSYGWCNYGPDKIEFHVEGIKEEKERKELKDRIKEIGFSIIEPSLFRDDVDKDVIYGVFKIEKEENDNYLQTICDYTSINRINGNIYKVFGTRKENLTC